MALAEALHHSAPRRPKTARAGMRPGVLEDPGPRRETEHVLYAAPRGPKPPSPGVPSLATPLLAGQATEVLDASTPRLPHTGCPGGEEEGRGGEGGEGEGEGGAEEAAHAAGASAGVLGAPGHSCGAPLGPAGVQDPCAVRADGPERRRGRSRIFFLPAGEEEEKEEEEEKDEEGTFPQLLFMTSFTIPLLISSVRCLGVA